MKAIGIDVGATKIEGVLVSEKFKVLKKVRIKTPKSKKQLIKKLVAIITELKGKGKAKIAIGVPGVVVDSKIVFMPNLKVLLGVNLKKELEKRIKQKIVVDNDANLFAVGEHKIGAGKGTKNLVAVTIGTGIGGGIVINKKLYKGQGWAGEIGHIIIHNGKDFEYYCSGREIKKRGINYEKLGIGLANVILSFNPDAIVIGGGIAEILNFDTIRKKVKRYLPKSLEFKIVKSKLSPAVGAAITSQS